MVDGDMKSQSKIPPVLVWVPGIYGGLGVLLWAIPLFNLLHAESSAVVAGGAFFVAGLSSMVLFGRGMSFRGVLVRQEAALVVPWLLLTLTLFWVPNCGYRQGLLFFLLFVPASVALAVALAYALSGIRWQFKKTLFIVIGLAVVLLTPLYDLGFHPQFYVYNHVFGGVLGPIYDEELVIRPGLVVFRGLTLLWALLAYQVGRRLRTDAARPASVWQGGGMAGITATVLGIGLCYLFAGSLGFNTSGRQIQQALSGLYQTAHCDIYSDPASLDADAVQRLAEDHEYRYAQLAGQLRVDVPERIASYLVPDAETKARLTGARTTNVAPVWLRRPQVHVLLPAYERVFAHELAHVFSRTFGLPVLRASLSVGMVEGLAVALEPPDGLPTPHEQVAAAAMQRLASGRDQTPMLAANLAARLSPLGFWTGRGAVSYTTMGSFTRYLLDAYGPDRLKRVYARGDFEAVYGKTVEALAQEWEQFVLSRPAMDRAAGDLVSVRFSIPSLFEKRCPHYVPAYERLFRRGVRALAAEDTAQALAHFTEALRLQPAYEPALAVWAGLTLAEGAPDAVLARLDTVSIGRLTPVLAVRLGDAHALRGHPEAAQPYYETALDRLPGYALEALTLVVMRKSLAREQKILHILTSAGAYAERARQLAASGAVSAEAGVMEAFFWAEAGQFEQAAERLRTTPEHAAETLSPYRQNVLRWQRLVWLARWSYQAGDPDAAAVYARRAARAFREAGALNAEAFLNDFEAKMGWLRQAGYVF